MTNSMGCQSYAKKSNVQIKLPILCIIEAILFITRAWNSNVIYIISAIGLMAVLFLNLEDSYAFLLFMLPCAPILKISPEQISYFTLMFLLYNIKYMLLYVLRNKSKIIMLIPLLLLFVYNLLFSGFSRIITNITMVVGLIMLMSINCNGNYKFKTALYCFCCGILLASIIALFKEKSAIISDFINEATIKLAEDEYIYRFAGLQGNPNYYTLDITIAVSALVVVMSVNKFNTIGVLLALSLIIFGLMSASKSFLISLIVLVVLVLLKAIFNRDIATSIKIISVFLILILGVYIFDKEAINTYMIRFNTDKGADLSEISTGRSDIWLNYIKAIFKDPYLLLFGNGLGTTLNNGKGAHNTYIETIFLMGIIGTAIICCSMKYIYDKHIYMSEKNHSYMIHIPVLLYLIRLFAIGSLTYDNTWYYISLLFLMHIDRSWEKE